MSDIYIWVHMTWSCWKDIWTVLCRRAVEPWCLGKCLWWSSRSWRRSEVEAADSHSVSCRDRHRWSRDPVTSAGQTRVTWPCVLWWSWLTCTSRRRPVSADTCHNAPPGDSGSSYRCGAGRLCWRRRSHCHYTQTHALGHWRVMWWTSSRAGLTSCLQKRVQRAAGGKGKAYRCQRTAGHRAGEEEQRRHTWDTHTREKQAHIRTQTHTVVLTRIWSTLVWTLFLQRENKHLNLIENLKVWINNQYV